ncbi:hypothetical protein HanRHA438_Chr08g0339381 [Helianthus annuus]|nr:hypothetical protein HanRHA438_Chr08g0339381 [Helianthus annuus]
MSSRLFVAPTSYFCWYTSFMPRPCCEALNQILLILITYTSVFRLLERTSHNMILIKFTSSQLLKTKQYHTFAKKTKTMTRL